MSKLDFDEEIKRILREYGDDITAAAADVVEAVAMESAKKLKAASPRGKGKGHGKYARGWKYKVVRRRLITEATVHGNRNTYPLAHLLEKGHATRNGGRTRAFVHIKPVEEWAISEVEKRLKKKVERL